MEKVLEMDFGMLTKVIYDLNLVAIPVISEEVIKRESLIYNIKNSIILGVYQVFPEEGEIRPLQINDGTVHFNDDVLDIVLKRTEQIVPQYDAYIAEFRQNIGDMGNRSQANPMEILKDTLRVQYILEEIRKDILTGIQEGRGEQKVSKAPDLGGIRLSEKAVDILNQSPTYQMKALEVNASATTEDIWQYLQDVLTAGKYIKPDIMPLPSLDKERYSNLRLSSGVNMMEVAADLLPIIDGKESFTEEVKQMAIRFGAEIHLPIIPVNWITCDIPNIQEIVTGYYRIAFIICDELWKRAMDGIGIPPYDVDIASFLSNLSDEYDKLKDVMEAVESYMKEGAPGTYGFLKFTGDYVMDIEYQGNTIYGIDNYMSWYKYLLTNEELFWYTAGKNEESDSRAFNRYDAVIKAAAGERKKIYVS